MQWAVKDSVTIYNAINIGLRLFSIPEMHLHPIHLFLTEELYTIDEKKIRYFYPVSKM